MYVASIGTFLQRDPLGQPGSAALEHSHDAVSQRITTDLQSNLMRNKTLMGQNPGLMQRDEYNLYEYASTNPCRFTDSFGLASEPGFWSGYWYYLWNPGRMDSDLQTYQKIAVTTAVVSGTAAGGLAIASYAGVSQIGAVGLAAIPAQAAIEIHLAGGAAVTLTATCSRHSERVFQNSRAFTAWIVRGFPGRPDPGGVPGALRWDVAGTYNGSPGTFELVMDSSGRILHFLFRSH